MSETKGQITGLMLDSFSGPAADLPKNARNAESVLRVLRNHPRVSTWDMSENLWLRSCIRALIDAGKITEADEPYPWHRFIVAKEPAHD